MYCVVSTKQDQRLQTGVRLRDINATMTSRNCRTGRAVVILVVSTEVDGKLLSYGCYWISVQILEPLYPKCAISQTMTSQRNISNDLQYNSRQNSILISKKISDVILVV